MKALLLLGLIVPFVAFATTTTVRVGVTFVDPTTIQPATEDEEAVIEVSKKQESTVVVEDDTITVIYE